MTSKEHWTSKNIPDLRGRVILITGANSGIGFEAARVFARKNAEVIMACRNMEKGKKATAEIMQETPTAQIALKELNLASLDSVRNFATEINEEYEKLDILINNAGVMATPFYKTIDGFEMQMGTNHFGHFALTGLLLEKILKAEKSRIVSVSSKAHNMGKINFDDINSQKNYNKWGAYGQSKLANLLFAYELDRKLKAADRNTLSLAAHPGYSATNLQATSGIFTVMNNLIAQSQEMGALPTLFAATSPEAKGADFIGPHALGGWRGYPIRSKSNERSHNEEIAKHLWEVSEELTQVKYSI